MAVNSAVKWRCTVVSKKKRTFCELMESYIYLRNTQKQLKITSYGRTKFFFRILSNLQWCLFETSRIIIIEVRKFCISMYEDGRLILHHNFQCFKYLLLRFCLRFVYCQEARHLLSTLRSWQLPCVYTTIEDRHYLRDDHLYNIIILGMKLFL